MAKPREQAPLSHQWDWMLPSSGAQLKVSIFGTWTVDDAIQAGALLDMMKANIMAAAERQDAAKNATAKPSEDTPPRASDAAGDGGV